jgi:hypothetical protein
MSDRYTKIIPYLNGNIGLKESKNECIQIWLGILITACQLFHIRRSYHGADYRLLTAKSHSLRETTKISSQFEPLKDPVNNSMEQSAWETNSTLS